MTSGISRVLMTADTVGGVWTYALELGSMLVRHGIDVWVATMGALPTPEQRAEAQNAGVRLLESAYRLEWMQDPWLDVDAAGRWLLEIEEGMRPDLIHLNGYTHAALPFSAPKIVVAHSCVSSWFHSVKQEPLPADFREYHARVTAGLQSADSIVAPSQAMADALNRHYRFDRPVSVIPNGVNASRFQAAPKERFVFACGRLWDEAKNISALARIAHLLSVPVYVAGDTHEPGKHSVAHENVIPLGRLSRGETAQWLSRAAIFVHPARYEPFGLAVLEAALSRCALVLGDIASLRENWTDAATFVHPDQASNLRSTIEALVANESLRNRLSMRARRRALGLTASAMLRGYLGLYETVSRQRANEEIACVS
jgi:glycogen synthase